MARRKQRKNRRGNNTIIGVAVLLFFSCAICGRIGGFFSTTDEAVPTVQRANMITLESESTPTPTETPTDAFETATEEPSPTTIPESTDAPTSTPAVPTDTPLPAGPRANRDANLREGPGTNYAIAGGATAGQALDIVGQNSAGDWLQLANGLWIAAFLVDGAPADLPVTATDAFLPGGNPTPVPEDAPAYTGWSTTERGVEFRSDCPCDQGNILNCGDFDNGFSAQACWLKCMEQTGRDVHGLDRDNDGNACEWNW